VVRMLLLMLGVVLQLVVPLVLLLLSGEEEI
jgi:hypothetical protein